MGPVGVRALAGLRQRAPAVVALALVLAASFAITLACIAGSRRGSSALDRFVEHHRPGTVTAFVDPSLPTPEQLDALDAMGAAAGDVFVAKSAGVVASVLGPSGIDDPSTFLIVADAVIEGPHLTELARPIVVDGSLPLGDGEVAINEALARRGRLAVGDAVQIGTFEPDDLDVVGSGGSAPPAATHELAIGAVIRQPDDLARSPQAQEGTIFESDQAAMVIPPSFWAEHGGSVASYGMGLNAQAEDPDATIAAMQEAGGERGLAMPGGIESLQRVGPVGDAIDLESNALLAIGLLLGVATLVVLGPAAARVVRDDEAEEEALAAMGFTSVQLFTMRVARAVAIALPAAVLAVAGAILLSPLAPIGLAGDAEVDPGVHVDASVLAAGAPILALALIARAALAGRRRTTAARPSRLGALVAQAGASPTTTLGTELAIEAAAGRTRSAHRATIVGAVLGVAAVAGAVTFASSLQRLSDDPALQGWTWDVAVGNYSGTEAAEAGRELLEQSRHVAAFTGYQSELFEIGEETVSVVGFEPDDELGPVVLAGRAPSSDDEIALGRGTLAAVDAAIGDIVTLEFGGVATDLEVVGEIVAPAVIDVGMDLDSGGAMTISGLFIASDIPGDLAVPLAYLVSLREDVDRDAALASLREDFPGTVLGPMQPLDLQDLTRVRVLPYAVAAVLGLMALASTAIMVAAMARSRRRELGVLRALGFDRSRVRSLLATQSTVFTVIALLIGLPAGVVVGRQAWVLAADGLGTEVGPTVPLVVIAAATLGLVVVANIGTRVLTLGVARHPTADALRVE